MILDLLTNSKQYGVKIKRLLLDREFCSIKVVNLLQNMNILYIMPAKKSNPVKQAILDYHRGVHKQITQYNMTSKDSRAKFWLVIMKRADIKTPRKGKKAKVCKAKKERKVKAEAKKSKKQKILDLYVVFATNIDRHDMLQELEMVPDEYRKRWRIETGYRCVDNIRGKTTSKSMSIRTLLFFLAVVTFNLLALRDTTKGGPIMRY